MRKAAKVLGIPIGLFLVLLASFGPSDLGGLGSGWIRFAAVLVVAVIACALYLSKVYVGPHRTQPTESEKFAFHQVEPDRVLLLHEQLRDGRMPTLAQARVFATAVVEPTRVRRRMTEEYTPERRTLVQSTKVDVHLAKPLWWRAGDPETDEKSNGYVYLPAVIVPKGTLLDGFQVTGPDGESLSCLSYREYLVLVAGTLRVLLGTAYRLPEGQQIPDKAMAAECIALSAIIERTPPGGNVTSRLGAADVIAKLDAPYAAARDLAALFVRALIPNYAIVFVTDPPKTGQFAFRYTRTHVPDMKLARLDSKHRWTPPGLLRVALGAKPVELTIDIKNAGTAQSFHLHVRAPDGLYLARQVPIGVKPILERRAQDAPTPPHCRFRRRLGQPHAHFYSRYMPPVNDDECPHVRFQFFEVPPGSTMRAAVTALACLSIVWIVAFLSARSPGINTDAPAFLLAFPAVVAAWLGFEAPSQRLLEGTLAARFCLAMSALLSIASSAIFLAGKSAGDDRSNWPHFPWGASILGVSDLAWAIVTLLALLNSVVIVYKYVKGVLGYIQLSSRPLES